MPIRHNCAFEPRTLSFFAICLLRRELEMIFEDLIDIREIKWHASMFRVVQEAPEAHAKQIADDLGLDEEDRYRVYSTVGRINMVKNCLAIAGAMAIATMPYICVKTLTR